MLALSASLGQGVMGADGVRVGKLADLAVRLDEPHPAVTRLRVEVRRRRFVHVAWELVAAFEPSRVDLRVPAAEARESPLAEDDLLLARHVLDTQVFDVAGRRLTRVDDVELVREGDRLRLAGVAVGGGAILRRLGLGRLDRGRPARLIDWEELQLIAGRGYALHLRAPAASVHRLAPSELAELVSRLPLERGAEVIGTVRVEQAAGAIASARPGLGGRLVGSLEPDRAAPIVGAMPLDDAVSALRHLERDRLEAVLGAIPTERAAELRRLLAYPPRTAGGLMNPNVRTARPDEPVEAVRARLAAARPPRLEGLGTVFVVGEDGRVVGAIGPSALLASDAKPAPVPTIPLDADVEDVIDLFALHDALALPVVDEGGRLAGAIAVDDVLEELLIERLPGRRRFPLRSRRRHAPA